MDCPYIGTISRSSLNFSKIPQCKQTLLTDHIYACLICGIYLRGKGKNTPVYNHSLEMQHYLFICLDTLDIYCIPDMYQVVDGSLDDIRMNIQPGYNKPTINNLSDNLHRCRSLDGTSYIPGCIGLNYLSKNGYIAIACQLLNKITYLKNYLLLN